MNLDRGAEAILNQDDSSNAQRMTQNSFKTEEIGKIKRPHIQTTDVDEISHDIDSAEPLPKMMTLDLLNNL